MKTRILLSALVVCSLGCDADNVKSITQARMVPAPAMATADGTATQGFHAAHPPIEASGMAGSPHARTVPFRWTKPASWADIPPTSMRLANFSIPDRPRVECYISTLSGAAGGVAANVNRWRNQMGQPDLASDEIAALPTVEVMGKPASMVETTGSYTGMKGATEPNYTLRGLVLELPGQVLFVKMIGPTEDVAALKEDFVALCASIASVPPEDAP
ncbi:MAG TPA: hypothetical protein PLO62_01420 [Candidatus Hydrogenedentes bacterium]|nr:hypothetical protein [Candidatus Hydrogenedentota bacterium]HOS01904.1 hypothetical protein [Candidatus Hydrogenedentota bacterium]